ncbi:TIGR02206 family membrane protein [Flavobacteriaceae bacterium]|nr:TIGR02206 family membrane protein [Flavobacteriaceae bacterium]
MSYEGLRNFSITFILILFFLWSGRYIEEKNKIIFAKAISVITLIITLSNHIIDVNNGTWDIYENLPLHLCSISNLIACFILFIPKNQKLFEFLFYCGFWGGLMAILTAQINDYDGSLFKYIQYYTSHGTIIFMPLYMFYNLNYKLSKFSWLKLLLILNIFMAIIIPINFKIGSNYMYLAEAPNIKNPLVYGDWPFYIVNWEFIIIILFYLTYVIFSKQKV